MAGSTFGIINNHGINLNHVVYYKKKIVVEKDLFYFFNKKQQTRYYLEIRCLGDEMLTLEFDSESNLDLIFEKVNRTVL